MTTRMPTSAAHILAAYRSATPAQRKAGERWYPDAHAEAVRLDPANPGRAAGVIAALSPQTPWDRNLELAGKLYADGGLKRGTLGQSIDRANRIFHGEDPLAVLHGPKTRAFYTLINDPADPFTVVIDRHAVDAAIGEPLSTADREARYPLHRGGRYEGFVRLYLRAGKILGVPASWAQATTWLVEQKYAGVRIGGLTHV